MLKKIAFHGSIMLLLIGCNLEPSVQPEIDKNPSSEKSGPLQKKNAPAYALSVVPDWIYVGAGWDAAAGVDYYYYIRDSDRKVFRSPIAGPHSGSGTSWQDMGFPGRANRISASNGSYSAFSGAQFGIDQVAVVGEDGYVYLSTAGSSSWTKMTNRGNFIDVTMNYRQVLAIGSDNLMYAAGEADAFSLPGAASIWVSTRHPHITQAVAVEMSGSSNGLYYRHLISNTSAKLYWWNGSWIYRDASNVRDLCGTKFGNFDGWGNFWIVSTSGQLNYHTTVNALRWAEWRATNVSRVGCSNKSRLIVVNFDRTTYIKNEAVTEP